MSSVEQRARELLAAEYQREGIKGVEPEVFDADRAALRAIAAALREQPEARGAPVGVEGLVTKWRGLANDALRRSGTWGGNDIADRIEFMADELEALTQQRAQAAPGDDDSPEKDVAVWELIRIAEECGAQKDSDDDHTWWSLDLHAFYKLEDRMTDAVSRMRYTEAATPPGDDAAGGGRG